MRWKRAGYALYTILIKPHSRDENRAVMVRPINLLCFWLQSFHILGVNSITL